MISRTEAIVLRVFPYSETSRVVSWLGRDTGRLTTLVKGALRPKGRLLGQFDLFYTCEVLYYDREPRELFILKECAPLKPRPALRDDWRACAVASYLADLLYRISPARAHHPGLFGALDAALDHLAGHGAAPAFVFWFELKLLQLLGLSPMFRTCAQCRAAIQPAAGGLRFAYDRGGTLCPRCACADAPHTLPIAGDVLAALSAWQRARSARASMSARATPRQLNDIETLLGLFLRYHLDQEFRSRAVAMALLRAPRPLTDGPQAPGPAPSSPRTTGPRPGSGPPA